ncbi:MAG: DUF5681 domain-containing protein [bacterium]|nr:DUF5681 domain-containing protein [bacterium]
MAQISETAAKRKPRRHGPGRPWQPGQSGNPGGRPKAVVAVAELARQHTEEAVATLAAIMRAEVRGVRPGDMVRAAEALLARGWGQPTQPLEHAAGEQRVVIEYVNDWRGDAHGAAMPKASRGP